MKAGIIIAGHFDANLSGTPFNREPFVYVNNKKLGSGLSDNAKFITEHLELFDEVACAYYACHEEEFSGAPHRFDGCDVIGLCHYRRFLKFGQGDSAGSFAVPSDSLVRDVANGLCVLTKDICYIKAGVLEHVRHMKLGSRAPMDFMDPEFARFFKKYLGAQRDRPGKNMFLMGREWLVKYTDYYLDLVRRMYAWCEDNGVNMPPRFAGYLSELVLPAFLVYNKARITQVGFTRESDILRPDVALNISGKRPIWPICAYVRHRYLRSWLTLFRASGDKTPLLLFRNVDWTDEDVAMAEAAAKESGGMLCTLPKELYSHIRRRVMHNSNWRSFGERVAINFALKLYIYREAFKQYPDGFLWLDDDVEVLSPLDPLFDFSISETCRNPQACIFCNRSRWGKRRFGQFGALLLTGGAKKVVDEVISLGEAGRVLLDDEIGFMDYAKTHSVMDRMVCYWSDHDASRKFVLDPSFMNPEKVRADMAEVAMDGCLSVHWYCIDKDVVERIMETHARRAGRRMPGSPEEEPVDAVFVVGDGSSNGNIELRFALRNIEKHCTFVRDVYICGVCPDWIDKTKVKWLKWPDRFHTSGALGKDSNIIDKLRHACEHPGMARRVLFCSDDQFQMRSVDWEDFRPRWVREFSMDDDWYAKKRRTWHTRLRSTLVREVQRRKSEGLPLGEIYYYEPHMYMQIDRDKFLEYAKWADYEHREDVIIASGYFNFAEAAGVPDFDHVFLSKTPIKSRLDVSHIAYSDDSLLDAMSLALPMFERKSRFEKEDIPVEVLRRLKARVGASSPRAGSKASGPFIVNGLKARRRTVAKSMLVKGVALPKQERKVAPGSVLMPAGRQNRFKSELTQSRTIGQSILGPSKPTAVPLKAFSLASGVRRTAKRSASFKPPNGANMTPLMRHIKATQAVRKTGLP